MVRLLTGFMLGQSTPISYHTEANGCIFITPVVSSLFMTIVVIVASGFDKDAHFLLTFIVFYVFRVSCNLFSRTANVPQDGSNSLI